jgi:hypothetical protein
MKPFISNIRTAADKTVDFLILVALFLPRLILGILAFIIIIGGTAIRAIFERFTKNKGK